MSLWGLGPGTVACQSVLVLQPGSSHKHLPFWVFTETLSCRHDWLTHWPLMVNSTLNPSPFLEIDGTMKVPALYSTVGSPGNQPSSLSALQKLLSLLLTHFWWKGLVIYNKTLTSPLCLWSLFRNWGLKSKYNKKCFQCSPAQEIPRIGGFVSQELWTKTKYAWEIYFHNLNDHIYVNHSITGPKNERYEKNNFGSTWFNI